MSYVRWADIRGRHLEAQQDLCGDVVFEPGVGVCWVCGEPADYLDLSFEAPVCGGICVWAAWQAFLLTDRGRDPW